MLLLKSTDAPNISHEVHKKGLSWLTHFFHSDYIYLLLKTGLVMGPLFFSWLCNNSHLPNK